MVALPTVINFAWSQLCSHWWNESLSSKGQRDVTTMLLIRTEATVTCWLSAWWWIKWETYQKRFMFAGIEMLPVLSEYAKFAEAVFHHRTKCPVTPVRWWVVPIFNKEGIKSPAISQKLARQISMLKCASSNQNVQRRTASSPYKMSGNG